MDAKDKALEFAEYMAKAAEEYQDAINKLDEAIENDDFSFQDKEDFLFDAGEAYRALSSAIYQFRKRAI
jgi:uncharacterized protein Yka (UPF0111/DUF47 family)